MTIVKDKKNIDEPNWPFHLKQLEVEKSGEIYAEVEFPQDCHWFHGHFPDKPILPGVAQLHLVVMILSKAKNKDFYLQEIKRIRFRQAIGPHEILEMRIHPKTENVYIFRLDLYGDTACSGTMTLKTINK